MSAGPVLIPLAGLFGNILHVRSAGSWLTMNFDGSGNRDPDGDTPLTYVWNFGDGSAPTETTEPTVNHSHPESGRFTVRLTVRDSSGKESVADATRLRGR